MWLGPALNFSLDSIEETHDRGIFVREPTAIFQFFFK